MSFTEYVFLVRSDLHRHLGRSSLTDFLRNCSASNPGFQYTFWLRTCSFLSRRRGWTLPLYAVAKLAFRHYGFKYGISISSRTSIGPGFYIAHVGGIVVNEHCTIGRNCNLSHDVTLGQTNRGARKGCPAIGDDVYIAPGAKVVGGVRIGQHAAIGANCVVTRDIPDNGVVTGVPGRVISFAGSRDYVNRTDYEAPGVSASKHSSPSTE